MSSDVAPAPADAPAASPPQLESGEVLQILTASLAHLRRFLRARVPPGCRTDPDDLAQEAFLRAFARLPHLRFRSRGEVLAYLRRTATNLLLDEHRRAARRPPSTTLDEEMAVRQATPLDRVLARERRRRVSRQLLTLRPEMRRAILLRLRGECDSARLTTVLRRASAGAARVAFARAVAALGR
jgi:RNA polymerase sigma factor (sigma-70 family)